jgi:hypothetical protein
MESYIKQTSLLDSHFLYIDSLEDTFQCRKYLHSTSTSRGCKG